MNILDNIPDTAGIYRIMGLDPMDNSKGEVCLYVGQAGQKKMIDRSAQGLKRRIRRHLQDDAGELYKFFKRIENLTRLEYWEIDPDNIDTEQLIVELSNDMNKDVFEIFNLLLNEFEIKAKNQQIPLHAKYLNRITEQQNITNEKFLLVLEKLDSKKIAVEYNYETLVSQQERQFRDDFRILLSDFSVDLFNKRSYKSLEVLMSNLFESWTQFHEDFAGKILTNLHWTKF